VIRFFLLILLMCCQPARSAPAYDALFSARFDPQAGVAHASLQIGQAKHRLRQLDLAAPPARFREFSGDGEIVREGDRLLWNVPANGGTLRYQAKIDHRKGENYDARITGDWAVLRLDDVFPAARVRATSGAVSRSSMELQGPSGWTFESRYGPVRERIEVGTPGRRFSRPTGWLVAGDLGVRRDELDGRTLAVAGPVGQGLRRLDTLAFMRWTLPALVAVFPDFPNYFLIVRARDDMWRGGLSGPSSLFLHADRPLISENATSTLLHELVHLATGQREGKREDWLIEGLAEYYSLEILLRTGGISQRRHDEAMARLEGWAERENGRLQSPSAGANTARAVVVLRDVQAELSQEGAESLDPVATDLISSGDITGVKLKQLVAQVLGRDSKVLAQALKDYAVAE
jgi:hypothetical protein